MMMKIADYCYSCGGGGGVVHRQLLLKVLMMSIVVVSCSTAAAAQPKGIDFSIQVCTSAANCVQEQAGIVTSYVYTGCTDPTACNYVHAFTVLLPSPISISIEFHIIVLHHIMNNALGHYTDSAAIRLRLLGRLVPQQQSGGHQLERRRERCPFPHRRAHC